MRRAAVVAAVAASALAVAVTASGGPDGDTVEVHGHIDRVILNGSVLYDAIPTTTEVTSSTTATPTTVAPTTAAPSSTSVTQPPTTAPTTSSSTTSTSSTTAPSTTSPATPDATPDAFIDTFDGSPSGPVPFNSPNWDISIETRDAYEWVEMAPMSAQHGHDCAPTGTHTITSFEQAVFQCRDHVMTAFNAASTGDMLLTPNALVDFTDGEAVVSFDISTLQVSERDWWSVWISPWDQHNQIANDITPPRNGFYIQLGGVSNIKLTTYRDGRSTEHRAGEHWWKPIDMLLSPSATRRDRVEVRVSRTSLSVCLPGYSWPGTTGPACFHDVSFPAVNWGEGVVQIGHSSYNPTKSGNVHESGEGRPSTWHWDNVRIDPAVRFQIVKGDRRYVLGASSTPVTFDRPAPAGAMLRFHAVSESTVQVSFDGGVTWQPARKQPVTGTIVLSHATPYFTPIPEGTTSVRFRGSGEFWGKPWIVRDVSVWAR